MNIFCNNKKNHHYISQVEQRLNSVDDNSKKIYKFRKINGGFVESIGSNPVNIEKNLSFHNLFTFSYADNEKNYNFEDLFCRYENKIRYFTEKFEIKITNEDDSANEEIINIFICKFMSMIRNPYSVKLAIDMFSPLILDENIPKGGDFDIINDKIKNLTNNKKEEICNTFNFSEEDYKKWLMIIFSLFGRHDQENRRTPIEELAKQELFDIHKTIVKIDVYNYDDERCLISDKGYCEFGVREGFNLTFNIYKKCFASFTFISGNGETVDERESYFDVHKNVVDVLEKYNSACIKQSHEHVFCSSDQFLYSQEAL